MTIHSKQTEIDAIKEASRMSLNAMAKYADALKAENEKLRKDAERYLYLRNKACTSFVWDWESECGLIKDNNIDAAMTAPDTKGE